MSVFDPTKDYKNRSEKEQPDIQKTILEVQKVIEEITQIMQMQGNEEEEDEISSQESHEDEESYDEEEGQYSIYDDIFEM